MIEMNLEVESSQRRTPNRQAPFPVARAECPRQPDLLGVEGALSHSLSQALPRGAVGAVRRILPGDEDRLTRAETVSLGRAVPNRRRASGAARVLARALLGAILIPPPDILRSPSGAPIWPDGIIGSLAHDESLATAVVGSAAVLDGIGVDIEPAERLEDELIASILSPVERRFFSDDPLGGKTAFCVKEAVFKAVNPRDCLFLEFGDVALDPTLGIATTSYGRVVHWRAFAQEKILAVAWW
jgi:4'-phosphopantetheinyl transferase EntD